MTWSIWGEKKTHVPHSNELHFVLLLCILIIAHTVCDFRIIVCARPKRSNISHTPFRIRICMLLTLFILLYDYTGV